MSESARRADAWTVARRLVERQAAIERQLEDVLRRARLPRLEMTRAATVAESLDPQSLAPARRRLEAALGRPRETSLLELTRPEAATKKGALRC